jgi:hypothetical protein
VRVRVGVGQSTDNRSLDKHLDDHALLRFCRTALMSVYIVTY